MNSYMNFCSMDISPNIKSQAGRPMGQTNRERRFVDTQPLAPRVSADNKLTLPSSPMYDGFLLPRWVATVAPALPVLERVAW